MRLRSSLVVAVLLALTVLPGRAQQAASAPASAPDVTAVPIAASAPAASASGVQQAIQQLRDEGHFGKKHSERYLRFKPDKKEDKPKTKDDSWAWWRHFGEWLNNVGRVGIWTLGALAVAVLAVLALRMRRQAADAPLQMAEAVPQRVRQYDIRPESLPADVGAAAWAQWQAGELRPALALLYRGALSRLVHRHAVPIRGSSTEGDCMTLAQRHLPAERAEYFDRVTRARLLGSYAGRWPDGEEVRELCRLFEQRLASPPRAEAPA